jgi:hypothetical protein
VGFQNSGTGGDIGDYIGADIGDDIGDAATGRDRPDGCPERGTTTASAPVPSTGSPGQPDELRHGLIDLKK